MMTVRIRIDSEATLTSYASIFLPDIPACGRHQARYEYCDHHEYEHSIEPGADAPKTTSPIWMLKSGTSPPIGVNESCIELTAAGGICRDRRKQRGIEDAKPHFFLPCFPWRRRRARAGGIARRLRAQHVSAPARKSVNIAAHTAHPCFWFFTMRPR